MDLTELYDSVGDLFDLLDRRGIDYVVAGGIAMLAHVQGRNTQDIDLILSREAVAALPELVVEDENDNFLRAKFEQLQVDVLLAANRFFAKIAENESALQQFADRKVRCATPRGLALLKLFSLPSLYRQGDFTRVRLYEGDIEALLASFELPKASLLEPLRGELLESDVAELEQVVDDIQRKIDKQRSRFRDS